MTKFVHHPTTHKTLIQACTQLDNLPRSLEVLMFAIYTSAVYSIDDEECQMKLGEPRKPLLRRYQHATRKALARAKFMGTSELAVLQAFLLYLLTVREDLDARTTWTLTGVASRVAQNLGLHRDGSSLGVSPFETEMRRRIWWQVISLDGRSAELSGSGRFSDLSISDTRVPTNVNDEDIYPDMKDAPTPQIRPTEMISCLARYEMVIYFKEQSLKKDGVAFGFESLRLAAPWKNSAEEREAFLDGLEQRLEEKFLRYCDPSVPIQFMTTIIGRGAINSIKIMAHHPRKWGQGVELPSSEREYLWRASLKLLEGLNLAHSSRQLRRFMWHTRHHFVWQAFIYILNELKEHPLRDGAEKAWQEVKETYRHHPHFINDFKKPLHIAVGSLCLKAHAAREQTQREATNGVLPKAIPEYIHQLSELLGKGPLRQANAAAVSSSEAPIGNVNGHAPGSWSTGTDAFSTTIGWDHVLPPSQSSTTGDNYFTTKPSSINRFEGAGAQMPLPAFQPMPMPLADEGGYMFASEPSLAHDLAMADVPLDWAQWDLIMQDMATNIGG